MLSFAVAQPNLHFLNQQVLTPAVFYFILFCEICELAVVCVCSSIPKLNRLDISQKCTIMMTKYKKFQSLQKKGTGNREQGTGKKHSFAPV